MAIKTVSFAFDVPITTLLSLVATGNVAMRVDVMGDGKGPMGMKALKANGIAGLLEHQPKDRRPRARDENGNHFTAQMAIAKVMLAEPDKLHRPVEFGPVLEAIGLSRLSATGQIIKMREKGFAQKDTEGNIRLTAKGARHFMKLFEGNGAAK